MVRAEGIAEAARHIPTGFRDTPQYVSPGLSAAVGCEVVLKVETANPIRSFKGRGAAWLVRNLPDDTPLVCASAGNFGQGLAYAGGRAGIDVHVFAAESATPAKVQAMQALGARVRLVGTDFDEAKEAARDTAERHGWRYIEDGREPAITEGAGSIAVELARWPDPLEAVLAPVGNGALIGGIGTWMRFAAPGTQVVGVVAAAAPSMARSWRARQVLPTASAATVADGIAVRQPVPEALAVMEEVVDDMVEVGEGLLREAAQLVGETTGLLAEPAGSAGVAALLADSDRWRGRRVAVPLCGSNVDRRPS